MLVEQIFIFIMFLVIYLQMGQDIDYICCVADLTYNDGEVTVSIPDNGFFFQMKNLPFVGWFFLGTLFVRTVEIILTIQPFTSVWRPPNSTTKSQSHHINLISNTTHRRILQKHPTSHGSQHHMALYERFCYKTILSVNQLKRAQSPTLGCTECLKSGTLQSDLLIILFQVQVQVTFAVAIGLKSLIR